VGQESRHVAYIHSCLNEGTLCMKSPSLRHSADRQGWRDLACVAGGSQAREAMTSTQMDFLLMRASRLLELPPVLTPQSTRGAARDGQTPAVDKLARSKRVAYR
jgi:hypothetical protein